jgi:hypothetical protein
MFGAYLQVAWPAQKKPRRRGATGGAEFEVFEEESRLRP